MYNTSKKKITAYIHKRNQILKILTTIECEYYNDEYDFIKKIKPSEYQVVSQADLILQKMGMNKPEFLIKKEGKWLLYTSYQSLMDK